MDTCHRSTESVVEAIKVGHGGIVQRRERGVTVDEISSEAMAAGLCEQNETCK